MRPRLCRSVAMTIAVLMSSYSMLFIDKAMAMDSLSQKQEARERIGKLKQKLSYYEAESEVESDQNRAADKLSGFYIKGGFNWVNDSFDIDKEYPADSLEVPFGFEPEYLATTLHATVNISLQAYINVVHTFKVNVGAGYAFSPALAVEFNLDYLSVFYWDNLTPKPDADYFIGSQSYVYITTSTVSAKYTPSFFLKRHSIFKPYIHIGGGMMFADLENARVADDPLVITYPNAPSLVGLPINVQGMMGYDQQSDFCIKYGLGFDVLAKEKMKYFLDYSFIDGLGDVADLNVHKVTSGIMFLF
ncbi:MAG: outer membrane beta-barrel protein [Pseudomonadales bacterium]|nr:outer membrane beta-barrel protein [Pseudomonadales bacterium]